jgi:hypothetical protein
MKKSTTVSSIVLRARLSELQSLERKCKRQHKRFAFYDYLDAVFALYSELRAIPDATGELRKVARRCAAPIAPDAHGIRIILDITSTADEKTRSRWTRALRYAWIKREHWTELARFFALRDGVAGCADRFAARQRRRRKQNAVKRAPATSKSKSASRCRRSPIWIKMPPYYDFQRFIA